jgi:hypothetical protein
MKYKHVFFTWLLADGLLAAVLLVIAVWSSVTGGGSDMGGIYLFAVAYGVVFSLPSLVIMSIFYFILKPRQGNTDAYRKYCVFLIIGINVLYFVTGWFTGWMEPFFSWFYLCSTAAGLCSFYFVNRRINKKLAQQENTELVKTVY